MTYHQDSRIEGHNNTVVQIVGDGNTVTISGAAALRLVRYEQVDYAAAAADPEMAGEPGFTATGLMELEVLSPFNRGSLPFQGRAQLLADLTAWRDAAGPWLSVNVVTGTVGRGKTRLAQVLVDAAHDAGWMAGFARKDDLDVFVSQGCRTAWTKPTLVVVDYAASKVAQLERWLRTLAVEGQQERPLLRILLLERTGNETITWWKTLFGARDADGRRVRKALAPGAPMSLAALSSPEERHAVFAAAHAAATTMPVPEPSPALDWTLSSVSMGGEPLFLAMFGLVAARQGLTYAAALSTDQVAMDLAAQELQRIGRIWESRGLPLLPDQPLHAHLAAAVSLSQGLTAAEIDAVIADESAALGQAIPAAQTAAARAALHAALPGEAGGIAPILPDILGEAAAVLAFEGLPDRGAEVVERLAEVKRDAVTTSVVKACQDFLIREQRLPMDWLQALRAGAVDLWALIALADALPLDTLELREIAVELNQSVLHLARDLPEERRALICAPTLNTLSNNLSDLGCREEALAASEEAVATYRSLAAARPDAVPPGLALSLNNLSNRLSDLGRHEEAFAAIEEVVAHYRSFAASEEAVLPDLALSLNNLSLQLSYLGRREEALAAIEEAVATYRSLAAARPDAVLPNLAGSLSNLSLRLFGLGRREEALAVSEEAVAIRRSLAAARPDAVLPDLTRSLNNLSALLSDLGRREEALAAIKEAVAIDRSLAAARPDVFLPDLAASLNDLSIALSSLGRREEALAVSEEAVALRRSQAAARSDAVLPDLAMSLNNLSLHLCGLDRHEDALAAIEEAVALRRSLAVAHPDAVLPDLAASLGVMSHIYERLDRPAEGARVVAEALVVMRPFVRVLPQGFASLALALIRDYRAACAAAGAEPDEALLKPLLEPLQPFIETSGAEDGNVA